MRSTLLRLSENRWLSERATRTRFVRRAVRRFMPGEEFDDMLAAAATLHAAGLGSLFTRLGENITSAAEADAVTAHYLESLDRVKAAGLPCEPSVKPTQLGLDLGFDRCLANLRTVAAKAHALGNYLWIDMEHSSYVDPTLELTRKIRGEFPRVGVAIQAYLRRTPQDLEDMVARGIGIRLVKGAYQEPESLVWPGRSEVDAQYLALAKVMLTARKRGTDGRAVFGTHDLGLVDLILEHARQLGLPRDAFEVHMLYGIQRAAQTRLAREGIPVRVLISYGHHWYVWYMRRLAERPANVAFMLRSLFG
jgi:proline dehydrogenase